MRQHDQAAAAEPLERAEGDQLGHVLADPAEGRADQEEHDRALEERLSPVLVAELAVERPGHGGGEQVSGHHPGEVVETAEISDDRRERGRDDRLVERGEQQHEHQRREDQADALRLLRRGGRRRCRRSDTVVTLLSLAVAAGRSRLGEAAGGGNVAPCSAVRRRAAALLAARSRARPGLRAAGAIGGTRRVA